MTPAILDVSCLCDAHTDAVLEHIYKAIGEDGPSIWDAHPNPYVRRIVELFTSRGLDRLDHVRTELTAWLRGEMTAESLQRPSRPAPIMIRWSPVEVSGVRLYLRSLPQASWTLDDWMLLVDYLVQKYLPLDDMRSEADWLASRSAMMGRVQAARDHDPTLSQADTILATLPSLEELQEAWGMSAHQMAAIDFGRARCAENVRMISEATRHKMRALIVDHQEAAFTGNMAGAAESIQGKLLDEFGTLNRDWRRIAVTEAGENLGQGFVSSLAFGSRIKRVEKYRGACAFCRSIDGMIMTVVDPAKPDKDGDKEVWVGKTNIGRSASPRKRVDGELVEREPDELLWVAAGTMHPHCRGAWVKVTSTLPPDPTFDAWLKKLDRRESTAP